MDMVSRAVLFASADARMPIGNKPLVLHALDDLIAADIRDVAVVAPAAVADEVQALVDGGTAGGQATIHAIDGECAFLDALGQLPLAAGLDPFVVHLGDSLTHNGLRQAIQGPPIAGNDALALVEKVDSRVKPLGTGLARQRAAGIYVFGPGVLDLGPRQGDRHDELDLEIAAAAERLAEAGGRIEVRPVSDWWRSGRRPDAMLQANRFFLSGLRPGPTDARLENTDLQGPVVLHPTARLTSAVVRGPVIVGADVEISDAYVGPYTSIGSNVVIENAEVENSIILPEAAIRHLGSRLEASIVGRRARVFRDFRLPRAFRLTVGDGAEVALT
jgi:glucose-1-phosphate thymidylyltransferase